MTQHLDSPVAALYCLPDSVYRSIEGVDVWDKTRDARTYTGRAPVVAHPPCAQWSRLRHFARRDAEELECGPLAVRQVREHRGVMEHPAGSALWSHCDLPTTRRDRFGGFTWPVSQRWFGHSCEKKTLLYIVGIDPWNMPPTPFDLGYAAATIETVPKRERNATPIAFAYWLVQLARLCGQGPA